MHKEVRQSLTLVVKPISESVSTIFTFSLGQVTVRFAYTM